MNTSFNRKDIEEFWRRSNSTCDQESDPDDLRVQVRRMSLADFTGLNQHQKLIDLETPTWKSSVSQSSLLNSYSTRRRSLLSSEPSDSPSRRIPTHAAQEQIDVRTALERLRSIRSKCANWKDQKSCETPAGNLLIEQRRTQDAIYRIQLVAKQLNQINIINSTIQPSIQSLLYETVSSATCLSEEIYKIKLKSSVYHSELVSTELVEEIESNLLKVFESLISFISKFDDVTMSANISTPSRKHSLISSSFSQLNVNLNVLYRAITSL